MHVRLDADSEAALAVLRAEGMSDSQAVRSALSEAGGRRRTSQALVGEARRLAADRRDREEIKAIGEELDELSPAWPD